LPVSVSVGENGDRDMGFTGESTMI